MKIGIVTGGGDCPGLNTVIRAVAKAADKRDWETIGILGGYAGRPSTTIYNQMPILNNCFWLSALKRERYVVKAPGIATS